MLNHFIPTLVFFFDEEKQETETIKVLWVLKAHQIKGFCTVVFPLTLTTLSGTKMPSPPAAGTRNLFN